MKRSIKYFLFCFFNLTFHYSFCQNSFHHTDKSSFVKSGDIFGTRVFVENKGQFDSKTINGEKIFFALDNGLEKIYFTKKGLTYEMIKKFPLTERQMEAMEDGKKLNQKENEVHYVFMNWVGANFSEVQIEGSEKQSHYITYGGEEFNSNTFKKLIYKNIYRNIDLEYIIPEDKAVGVKYSFILHPEAIPNDIKILYSGDIKKIKKNNAGEIIIKTSLDHIIEHIPNSYYSDEQNVVSEFNLKGDTISFVFPNGYQKNKTLIVDPWVSSVSSLPSNNSAYDVDYDYFDKTFIFGSYNIPKVACYNGSGNLQWSFSGTIINPSWLSQPYGDYVGNFAVDKFSSKCYIGQGVNASSSGNKVVRLNANGNYDNFITSNNSLYQEIWDMGFHCSTGAIFTLGGGHTSNCSAATINTANANLALSTFQPGNTSFVHDMASHAIDEQGDIFVYYSCSNTGLNNKICKVNSTFNNNIWTQPSTFNVLSEINNKNQFVGATFPALSGGFNCIGVNTSYLFYYDGYNLAAYNKSTGAILSSTTTNLSPKYQGGIAVDDCNNLYLGGNGSILTYSFDGISFSSLASISLSTTSSLQYVYDIKLKKITNTLYVSGSGFAGNYPAIYTNTCTPALGICSLFQINISINSSTVNCSTLGSATININGGTGPFSYSWIPSGQTGSVGTSLTLGTHTVIVYDVGTNQSYSVTTSFVSSVALAGNVVNTTLLNCYGDLTGTASVVNISGGSGNQTYLWTNGNASQTNTFATGLGAGNYSVTVTDALTNCFLTRTFTIQQPPQLNLFLYASSPTACVGGTILLSGQSLGGNSVFVYTWINGPNTNTQIITSSLAGSYNYLLNSSNSQGCQVTAIISVAFIPHPTLTVLNTTICPAQSGTLIATGASSYSWSNATTNNFLIGNPIVNTQYTVTGSVSGCSAWALGSIFVKPVPIPTLSSIGPLCNGQDIILSVTGGTSYLWNCPVNFTSANQSIFIPSANSGQSGIYSVVVTGANSCTASVSTSVSIAQTLSLSASGANICTNQLLTLSAGSSSGTTFMWQGPNGFNSNVQYPSIQSPALSASGNYTVYATSIQGCTNSAIVTVTVIPQPTISVFTDQPKCEFEKLNLFGASSQSGTSFSWTGPNNFSSNQQNCGILNAGLSANGIYSLTITYGPCLTTNTTMVTIHALPSLTAFYNSPICEKAKLILDVSLQTTNTITNFFWMGPQNFVAYSKNTWRDSCQLNYSGIYTVSVTYTNGCKSNDTISISILQNPNVTASGDTVCLNDPAILKSFGTNYFAWYDKFHLMSKKQFALIPNANNTAITVYTVIGTSANGCTASATAGLMTRQLPQPTVSVLPSNSACMNSMFIMQGEGTSSYIWQGPYNFNQSGNTFSFIASSPGFSGIYTLTGIDQHNCRASVTTSITVFELPSGGIVGGKLQGCVPFCSEYTFQQYSFSSNIISFGWQINNTKMNTNQFSFCFNESGDYIINGWMLDDKGCSNTNSVLVTVWPKPVADFSWSPKHPVENIDEIQLVNNSANASEFNWFFMNNETIEGKNNVLTRLFEDAGNYPVALVVSSEHHCLDTVVKFLKVEEDFQVYIPNAFTPNSDTKNEVFMPIVHSAKELKFEIFDRWGNEVFETNTPGAGWDGTYKNKECKQDVYVWKLYLKSTNTSLSIRTKALVGEVVLYR